MSLIKGGLRNACGRGEWCPTQNMGAQHTKDRVVTTTGAVGLGVSSGSLSVRGAKSKPQQQLQGTRTFKDGRQQGSNIFTEHNGIIYSSFPFAFVASHKIYCKKCI